jgi:hypothetical protein
MDLEIDNFYSLNMYEVGVQFIIQIDSQKFCTPFNECFVLNYNIYAYLIGSILLCVLLVLCNV